MPPKYLPFLILGGVLLAAAPFVLRRLSRALADARLRRAYQPRPLFSAHEKQAYRQLRQLTDRLGLLLFVKVRLVDLVEPREGQLRYQTYLYQVLSKHVDFVVCTADLNARLVLELDDFTHDRPDWQARDHFVDTVLRGCGYEVVHTRTIDAQELAPILRRLRAAT